MPGTSYTDSFDCPHCGEPLTRGAQRCRYCGASRDNDWEESEGHYATGGYGDDDFDYDEFVAREFGEDAPGRINQSRNFWIRTVIIALVIALLLPFVWPLLSMF